MKTLLKLVLGFLVFYLCVVAGSFFGGVVGAIVAAALHVGPYVIITIVRVLSTLFFFGFLILALRIYFRRKKTKSSLKNSAG